MLDALIIGAGISGLHTAWRLERVGHRVRVCEARERIGGRLLSAKPRNGDGWLDLGATWIWAQEPRVGALVEALGLDTYRHHEDGALLYDIPDGPRPVPGAPDPRGALRIVDGTAALPAALAARLDAGTLRLGTPVAAITDAGDSALAVTLGDGTQVETRQVVVAVPPTLAMARIAFTPGLPRAVVEVAASTPVWMGNIVKTVVVYDRPFWRDQGLAGTAMSALGPMQEIHDLSGPDGSPAALFGFTGLPTSDAPPPSTDAVRAQMVRLFGPRAAAPRQVIVQDWRREAETVPPDAVGLADYGLFGHPVYDGAYFSGRLHFCSCETSGVGGHIEDALVASERAVSAVLESLGSA